MLSSLTIASTLLDRAGAERVVVLAFTSELRTWSADRFAAALVERLGMRQLMVGPGFALGRGREGHCRLPEAHRAQARLQRHDHRPCEPWWRCHLVGAYPRRHCRRQARQGDRDARPAVRARWHDRARGGAWRRPRRPHREPGAWTVAGATRRPASTRVGCDFGDGWRPAATGIGTRPTFGGGSVTVEAHVLDFAATSTGAGPALRSCGGCALSVPSRRFGPWSPRWPTTSIAPARSSGVSSRRRDLRRVRRHEPGECRGPDAASLAGDVARASGGGRRVRGAPDHRTRRRHPRGASGAVERAHGPSSPSAVTGPSTRWSTASSTSSGAPIGERRRARAHPKRDRWRLSVGPRGIPHGSRCRRDDSSRPVRCGVSMPGASNSRMASAASSSTSPTAGWVARSWPASTAAGTRAAECAAARCSLGRSLSTLLGYAGRTARIEIDGTTLDRSVRSVVVANGLYFGGGMRVAPGAVARRRPVRRRDHRRHRPNARPDRHRLAVSRTASQSSRGGGAPGAVVRVDSDGEPMLFDVEGRAGRDHAGDAHLPARCDHVLCARHRTEGR